MWLTIALTTVICIMPVVAFRFLKLDLKPELSDTVRFGPQGQERLGSVVVISCCQPECSAVVSGRGVVEEEVGLCGNPGHASKTLQLLTCGRSCSLSNTSQVRYTQLVRKKQKTQHRCMGRVGRVGSRRSGYAFSHQEGFGELIMSGKNMRLSSLALSSFSGRPSTSWIETLRKKKSTGGDSSAASSPSGGGPDKTLKV